ncbi:MAG: carboxypeptidase regulatory-like domain-containing protein, partial [Bacteroidota bacterium]
MRPLFTAMILTLPCLLFAQFQVKGTLNDANAQPLGFANVLLLSNLDSSFVAGATSSDDGSFTLQTDQAGNFIVRASMLGFEEYNSEVFSLNTNQNQQMLPTIILQEGGIALESIEVTAEKPVFERQIDRTVVNVANTITAAGFTALEVLERSPGVIVNRASRSISMLGKEGVNVMINGK